MSTFPTKINATNNTTKINATNNTTKINATNNTTSNTTPSINYNQQAHGNITASNMQ